MNTLENILTPVRTELARIEKELVGNIDTEIPLLKDVLQYIMSTSGKRLRPAVHFLTARCFGYTGDRVYTLGRVLEYIHTATLLHDDVIDNADFRRSKQAARTIWGNEASVLVGDFLFSESFRELALEEDPVTVKMMAEITTVMTKGEIIQLARSYDSASEEDYLQIIEYKTSSLIALAAKLATHIAGENSENKEKMYTFGINFGNAFQIKDDMLDYTGEDDTLGKKKGIDLKERKITLPLCRLLAITQGTEKQQVLDVLNKPVIDDNDFELIKSLIIANGCIEYSQKKAEFFAQNAQKLLAGIPANQYSKSLSELVEFCIRRNY